MKEPLMQEGKFHINGSLHYSKNIPRKGNDSLTEHFILKWNKGLRDDCSLFISVFNPFLKFTRPKDNA